MSAQNVTLTEALRNNAHSQFVCVRESVCDLNQFQVSVLYCPVLYYLCWGHESFSYHIITRLETCYGHILRLLPMGALDQRHIHAVSIVSASLMWMFASSWSHIKLNTCWTVAQSKHRIRTCLLWLLEIMTVAFFLYFPSFHGLNN